MLWFFLPASCLCDDVEEVKLSSFQNVGDGEIPAAVAESEPSGKRLKFGQKRVHVPGYIDDIVVADFNKDGYPDIALIDRGEDIRVYLGDKDLEFKKKLIKKFADAGNFFAGAADFTGNGKLDLVTGNNSIDYYLSFFAGRGNGRFGKPKHVVSGDVNEIWPPELLFATTCDVDNDGKPDVVGFRDDGPIAVFRNVGKGKFKRTADINEQCYALAVGDFTGDQNDDFFITNWTDGYLRFFRSNGNGTFTGVYQNQLDAEIYALYSADLNKDGKQDLISDGYWDLSGNQSVWKRAGTMLGKGNGTLMSKKNLPDNGRLTYGATFADFNKDGKLDIAAAQHDGVRLYQGKGNGQFGKSSLLAYNLQVTPSGARVWKNNIAHGDLNKDGKLDIVGAQFFPSDPKTVSNLIFLINGGKPASLKISNLKVDTLEYDETNKVVRLKGSVYFSGKGIDMRYDKKAEHPTDCASLEFKIKIKSGYKTEYDSTWYASGEFIHKPGAKKGTVNFEFELDVDETISSTNLTTHLSGVCLHDCELVTSNKLDHN